MQIHHGSAFMDAGDLDDGTGSTRLERTFPHQASHPFQPTDPFQAADNHVITGNLFLLPQLQPSNQAPLYTSCNPTSQAYADAFTTAAAAAAAPLQGMPPAFPQYSQQQQMQLQAFQLQQYQAAHVQHSMMCSGQASCSTASSNMSMHAVSWQQANCSVSITASMLSGSGGPAAAAAATSHCTSMPVLYGCFKDSRHHHHSSSSMMACKYQQQQQQELAMLPASLAPPPVGKPPLRAPLVSSIPMSIQAKFSRHDTKMIDGPSEAPFEGLQKELQHLQQQQQASFGDPANIPAAAGAAYEDHTAAAAPYGRWSNQHQQHPAFLDGHVTPKAAKHSGWMPRSMSQDLMCSEELDLPSSVVLPKALLCDEALKEDGCYYEDEPNSSTSCSTDYYYSCKSSAKARLDLSRVSLYTDANSPDALAWCNDVMQKLQLPGKGDMPVIHLLFTGTCLELRKFLCASGRCKDSYHMLEHTAFCMGLLIYWLPLCRNDNRGI